MSTRMLQRRGLATEWAAANPILGEGEIGFVKDTGEIRIGDGVTPFETLTSPYATVTNLNSRVAKAGDTMTGSLTLAGVGTSLFVGGDTGINASEHILVQDVNKIALAVKQAAGSTMDLASFVNTSGVQLASIGSNGNLRGGQVDTSGGVRVGASAGASEVLLVGNNTGAHWSVRNISSTLVLGAAATSGIGGAVSPRLSLGGNDMVWDYQGLGNQRFRFTSDGTVEYIQTDLGLVFSAVGSGSPRFKINATGGVESHGGNAGISLYGRDNDTQYNVAYTLTGGWHLWNNVAGIDILQASNGSFGVYSNGLATLAAMNIGRNGGNELNLGIAGGGGQFFSNAAAGDMFIRLIDSTKALRIGVGSAGSILDVANNGAYVVGRVLASSRLSLYDDYSGLINSVGGRLTLYAYNGIEVRGGRLSATVPTPAASSGTESSMYVYPASISQTALSLARFSSGQTADIFRVTDVGNSTVFFAVQNNGNLWLSGSSWLGSSISTGDTMHMSHATHGLISIAYAGVGEDNDNYGIVGLTAPASVNRAYYSMTAAGNSVYGMGMGADNVMRLGAISSGKIMGNNVIRIDGSGNLSAPGFVTSAGHILAGLSGATAGATLVGATASGAPTTGTFSVGDTVIDRTGKIWICTTAGSPGTWTQVGGSGGSGGTTTKASYKDNSNGGSNLGLSGAAGQFTQSTYWTQIGNSVTIVCGSSGVIVLEATTQLVTQTNGGNLLAAVIPASSTTDAGNTTYNSSGQGIGWFNTGIGGVAAGSPVTVTSRRVITGLTPGTSYTYANYAMASGGGAFLYAGYSSYGQSGSSGCYSNLVATTY